MIMLWKLLQVNGEGTGIYAYIHIYCGIVAIRFRKTWWRSAHQDLNLDGWIWLRLPDAISPNSGSSLLYFSHFIRRSHFRLHSMYIIMTNEIFLARSSSRRRQIRGRMAGALLSKE
jgi:hypothetical protein